MKNARTGRIDLEMYGRRVVFCAGEVGADEFHKWVHQEVALHSGDMNHEVVIDDWDDEEFGRHHGVCFDINALQIVWVKDRRDINTIVHEVNHSVTNMAEVLGFRDMRACTEFFAYMNGYIVEKMWEVCK